MRSIGLCGLMALLVACVGPPTASDGPGRTIHADTVADAVPRHEPDSRYGNPTSYVVNGQRYFVAPSRSAYVKRGIASWYGKKFHGRRTSSGEVYDMYKATAAHRSLRLPSYAEVTNLSNGLSVVVKINDRGPFHPDRIIDLSYAAAVKIGIERQGTAHVEVRVIDVQDQASSDRANSYLARLHNPIAAATVSSDSYIQLGAYQHLNNARARRQQLQSKGIEPLIIEQTATGSGVWFRVLAGPYVTNQALDSAIERLQVIDIDKFTIVNGD